MTESAVKVNAWTRFILKFWGVTPEDVTLPPFRKVSTPPSGYYYKRIELVQVGDKTELRRVTRRHQDDDELLYRTVMSFKNGTHMKKMLVMACIEQAKMDKEVAEEWAKVQAEQLRRNDERRIL